MGERQMAKRTGWAWLIGLAALIAVPAAAQEHHGGGGGASHGGASHGAAPHYGYSRNLRPPGVPPGPHSPGFAGHSTFHPGPGGHDFHGRDFHSFGPQERATWQHGHWRHEWHDGRFGWWWWTGGFWYFYPVPIYPYPAYVSDVVVETQPDPDAYPPPSENGAPPPSFWYYCDASKGYYPYVTTCPSGWQEVPAKPAGMR